MASSTVTAIKKTAQSHFGKESRIYVFGSQLDDSRQGGDIDIYIETSMKDDDELLKLKIFFVIALHKIVGDQKIDVVINNLSTGKELPIYEIAKTKGMSI